MSVEIKSTLTSSLEILSPRHGVVECCPEVLEVEPEYHQQGTLEGGYNNHSSPSCLVLANRLTQEEGGGEDARPEPAAPCLTSAHHGNMTATLRGREHKCSDREEREENTGHNTGDNQSLTRHCHCHRQYYNLMFGSNLPIKSKFNN